MEKYTVENVMKMTSCWAHDEISSNGSVKFVNGENKTEIGINYSSILSKLIKEAGRFCDNYASDLFIQWKSIESRLSDLSFMRCGGGKFLFGFRESGVDHTDWVISRLNECGEYYYRSIWVLDIQVENLEENYRYDIADVKVTLRKISL